MTFKYFAYGSNMLTERLRERCKSAKAIEVGTINGYNLEFSKRSVDGSGKCNIVPSVEDDARVIGVLFEIASSEKSDLDRAEGLDKGYDRLDDLPVLLDDGGEVRATTYIGSDVDRKLLPYDWYHALVCAGAKQHGLPAEWIGMLERVTTVRDRNLKRDSRQKALKALSDAGYLNLLETVDA